MLNSFFSVRAVLLFSALGNVGLVCCSTKYYVTRNDVKKRLDEPKKKVHKDPIHTSNSNTYFVEDGYGYDSHELGDYGEHHDAYDYKGYKDYSHRYMGVEKKHSKFFGDELSFVIVVVTLTVFFGILSSLLIPLTLMLLNGGSGLFPFGGLNGVLPVAGLGGLGGIGGIAPGIVGRRRRSVGARDHVNGLEKQLDSALTKFAKQ